MDTLLSIIGSVVSGGATGLLGLLLQRFFDAKDKQNALEVVREQNRSAEALAAMESQRTAMQVQGQVEVALEQRIASETESYANLQEASYAHDEKTVLSDEMLRYCVERTGKFMGWILAFLIGMTGVARRGIRPGLTIYLTVVTYFMYQDYQMLLTGMAGAGMTAAEVHDIIMMIVKSIIYLTTTCVVWWFGASPSKRKGSE